MPCPIKDGKGGYMKLNQTCGGLNANNVVKTACVGSIDQKSCGNTLKKA